VLELATCAQINHARRTFSISEFLREVSSRLTYQSSYKMRIKEIELSHNRDRKTTWYLIIRYNSAISHCLFGLSSSFPRVERVLRELSADVIFVVIAIPLLCSLFLSLFCYTGSSDDHLAILCVHLLEHAILFIAIAHLYSCAYLKCFRLWNEARNYNKRDFNLRVE